jgi:hypothetical protein
MTREELLSFGKKIEPVNNTPVFVRTMEGAERASWLALTTENPAPDEFSAWALLARCLCNQDGTRILGDSKEDALSAGTLAASLIDAAYAKAVAVNALGRESREAISKNSDGPA